MERGHAKTDRVRQNVVIDFIVDLCDTYARLHVRVRDAVVRIS